MSFPSRMFNHIKNASLIQKIESLRNVLDDVTELEFSMSHKLISTKKIT